MYCHHFSFSYKNSVHMRSKYNRLQSEVHHTVQHAGLVRCPAHVQTQAQKFQLQQGHTPTFTAVSYTLPQKRQNRCGIHVRCIKSCRTRSRSTALCPDTSHKHRQQLQTWHKTICKHLDRRQATTADIARGNLQTPKHETGNNGRHSTRASAST